jgi:cobalt transporter subunit CbtA
VFQRIFVTALGAGIGVGLLVAALQHVALVPLILQAETYENAPAHTHASAPLPTFIVAPAQAHDAHDAQSIAANDGNSSLRAVLTTLATTLTCVGFALLLAGVFAVSGRDVDPREGLLWGLGGFAAFALAPAFGLPPELPGSVAADLVARQVWWVGTVASTIGGLALIIFARPVWAIGLGIAFLIVPHVIGAPHPQNGSGVVPPELAAAFAARSLVVNAVMWALLGLATGALYARLARRQPA